MSTSHPPFDDSYVASRRRASEDQSTPTAGFDAYRQGVELTLSKHYALGMLKIHSGYTGQDGNHMAPQFVYGQTQKVLLDEQYHRDVVPATLVNYFERSESTANIMIDTGTDLDVDVNLYDGVIEPFDIRAVVARKVTSRRYGRKLCAALGEGNVVDRQSSDVFVERVKLSDVTYGNSAMVDNVNNFGGGAIIAVSISVNTRVKGPFVENYAPKGVMTSSNMEIEMFRVLSAMRPGTENMIADGYSQLGASGFVY